MTFSRVQHVALTGPPQLQFHLAVGQTTLAHGNLQGNADQVGIIELDAGPVLPIVVENLQT